MRHMVESEGAVGVLPQDFRVNGIQVTDTIAKGGAAQVFEGSFTREGMPVPAAIKVALEPGAGRLQHERDINIALIGRPNIVPFLGHGSVSFPDGEHEAIAMTDLPGGSLDAHIRNGDLDPQTTVRLIEGAAQGLASVHEAGLVHYDMKPANILLDGNGQEAYVGDFGISTNDLPKGGRHHADRVSKTGDGGETIKINGTPLYLPPERARGAQPDPREDTFGLGVSAYEGVTNSWFRDRSTPPAILLYTVSDRASHASTLDQAGENLRRRGLGALEGPIRAATHIDPERRPETVTDFAKKLSEGLAQAGEDKGARGTRVARSIFMFDSPRTVPSWASADTRPIRK